MKKKYFYEMLKFLKHESIIDILCLIIWFMFHALLLVICVQVFFWKLAIYCVIAIAIPIFVLNKSTNDNKELIVICIKWIDIGFSGLVVGGILVVVGATFVIKVALYGFAIASPYVATLFKF